MKEIRDSALECQSVKGVKQGIGATVLFGVLMSSAYLLVWWTRPAAMWDVLGWLARRYYIRSDQSSAVIVCLSICMFIIALSLTSLAFWVTRGRTRNSIRVLVAVGLCIVSGLVGMQWVLVSKMATLR